MNKIAAADVTVGLRLQDGFGVYTILRVERRPVSRERQGSHLWAGVTEEVELWIRTSAGDEPSLILPPTLCLHPVPEPKPESELPLPMILRALAVAAAEYGKPKAESPMILWQLLERVGHAVGDSCTTWPEIAASLLVMADAHDALQKS